VDFDIQQYEVSWAEFDPWYASRTDSEDPERAVVEPPWMTGLSPDVRSTYPVSGIPWRTAMEYCRDVGGALPSEEQWEYAARGAELRPHPWGDTSIDTAMMTVFRGEDGRPEPVGQSIQDRTPGTTSTVLFDMGGNVREWTQELYRSPRAGEDESWNQGERTYRAIRGLPLLDAFPDPLPDYGAAWRASRCATGSCASGTHLAEVGFRCVRTAQDR